MGYKLGRFLRDAILHQRRMSWPKLIFFYFMVFMAVNHVVIYDDEAQDAFGMLCMIGGLSLIYGVITFRLWLIVKGFNSMIERM